MKGEDVKALGNESRVSSLLHCFTVNALVGDYACSSARSIRLSGTSQMTATTTKIVSENTGRTKASGIAAS